MIDKFTAVIKNSSDSTVCDLQMVPQEEKILTVSPTIISLIDISVPNTTNVLSVFNITENIQNEHGIFISAACLSINEFAILTSKGRISRFNISKSNKITLLSISIPKGTYYTCLTQYLHKYYLAGDEKGNFIIFSPELSILYINGILENPIKNISTSHSYGMIFLADGTLYSFKISQSSIEKGEFNLELFPELEFAEITPSKICTSNKFNTNAVYDPKGDLYLINKKEDMTNHTQKIFNLHGLLTMTFSSDENLLILIFKEKIGLLRSKYNRIFYFYRPEISICNSITVSSKFIALSMNDKGIALYPLIHRSNSIVPLMFSANKLFEFIPTNDGILMNEHEITISINKDDSNFIEFASADKYNKFIALSTKHRVFIYNRNSQQMKLLVDKISLIRDIEWFSRNLCVLSFDVSNTSFYLFIFQTKKNSSEFKLNCKIKIPSRPFCIRSNNDDMLVISLYKSILIIDKNMNQSELKIKNHFDDVYPHTNFIFALTIQKKLSAITYDGQILHLKDNVDAFFVSHKFDLLFVLSGTEIFVTSTSHIRFKTFICTDSIPIGVTIPNSICAFITVKNSGYKIESNLSFFFDYAISENEHFSPEKKKKALLALNSFSKDNKKSIILQSAVFLLRQKKSADCVSFISNFPDVFNEVMINALRCVESSERSGVYNFVGSASSFFANLTQTKIVKFASETIKFVPEKKNDGENETDDNDFRLSSNLLPVILEDEGFAVAFPAAFFLIANIHRFRKVCKNENRAENIKKRKNRTEEQTSLNDENKVSQNNNENKVSQNKNENKDSQNNNDNDNEIVDNFLNDDDSFDDFEFTQNEIDTLSSFFRFVEPILSSVSSVDTESVTVLGMKMSNAVYTELKRQIEGVITLKLGRMMKFYRPIQMYQFSVLARYSAFHFLSENRQEYENESIDTIVRHLKEKTFVKKGENHASVFANDEKGLNSFDVDLREAAEVFKRAGLRQWEIGILIAAGRIDEAKKSAENDANLAALIQKSEWHEEFGP